MEFVGTALPGLSSRSDLQSASEEGIRITERLTREQQTCGVCVVDLRRGETVDLLKLASGVSRVAAMLDQRLRHW